MATKAEVEENVQTPEPGSEGGSAPEPVSESPRRAPKGGRAPKADPAPAPPIEEVEEVDLGEAIGRGVADGMAAVFGRLAPPKEEEVPVPVEAKAKPAKVEEPVDLDAKIKAAIDAAKQGEAHEADHAKLKEVTAERPPRQPAKRLARWMLGVK